jgi:uncharacterized protein (DUF736 family)
MKKYILLLAIFVCHYFVDGANLVISPSPTSQAYCPLASTTYSVTNINGALPNCFYSWTIAGGTIVSGSAGINRTSVSVNWADLPGSGTLTVTTSNCSPSGDNGSTTTSTYVRRSVFGQNFIGPPTALCNNTINIPYCSPGVATVCADRMYIQGTGGIAQPPLTEVSRYIWSIPSGWKSNTTTGPATISTTSNSIPIEPLPTNTAGGTVTVIGSVSNACSGTLNSQPKTITITRTPILSITPPAGFTGAKCGITTPLTFSVTALACAIGSNYTWTVPAGWGGSSPTNSITVTPSGNNGGTLRVDIGLSTGGSVTVTYNISYAATVAAPQSVSTNNPNFDLCNFDAFSYTANPPTGYPTNFGFDWYTIRGTLINQTASSQSTPIHTTSNTVLVNVPGSVFGTEQIYVRMNNNNCTPSPYRVVNIKVGPYGNEEFSIIGPQTVCANQAADFRSSFITSDVTGYQWSAPSGWSNSGQGTPYFSVSVPSPFFGGAITLRLLNRCGWTNTPYVLNLSNSCFGFAASPNPAGNTLVISDLDPAKETSASLLDKNNNTLKTASSKDGKIELDLTQVPNGLYILLVKQNDKSETQQIVINH